MTWIQIAVLCVTFSVLQGYPTDGSIEEPGLGIFLEDILMNSVYGKCNGIEEDGNALKLLNDRVHHLVENIIQSLSEENHGIEISDQSKFMDLYDVPGLLDLLAVKMGESISNLAHYCGKSDRDDIGTRRFLGSFFRLFKLKPAPKPPKVAPKPPTRPQPKATKAPVTTRKPPTTTRKPETTTKPPTTTPEPENKKTNLKEKVLETAKDVAKNVVADVVAEGIKEVANAIADQVKSPNDESDENVIIPEPEITSIEQFKSDVEQENNESDGNLITPESDITTIEQFKSDVEQENVVID